MSNAGPAALGIIKSAINPESMGGRMMGMNKPQMGQPPVSQRIPPGAANLSQQMTDLAAQGNFGAPTGIPTNTGVVPPPMTQSPYGPINPTGATNGGANSILQRLQAMKGRMPGLL